MLTRDHPRRHRTRTVVALATAAVLVSGLVAAPASADADPAAERARCLALLTTGGPAVARAAEQALLGSDEDVQAFLGTGYEQARDHDDRVRVAVHMAGGGPNVRRAAAAALSGTADDIRPAPRSSNSAPLPDLKRR